ncbi:hydrogenase formation protein HypD [Candidatus Bathycorpusculum sp.]|uniref:hydrogenase formation protein HypD n=1 Tax=Candidatus Bathycorpusculum sp. TaxID=2994959 RepID=UPI0028341AE7|nr:hydrogenase formation protein HypD [Candidatus Termitimicrobium sp.]MCL2432529.1 hydrogenase formation protein HypD [Candidatus Termitimicrobium sp.]
MAELKRFRNPKTTQDIVQKIQEIATKAGQVRICHVCGTHEWTITHFGLRSLLPSNIEVIAGPGCPVCIVPVAEIDQAIELAREGKVITCFGDVLRVPGSQATLIETKATGADVRVVYAVSDAIEMAKKEPKKEFVFSAVGFETTAPITATEALGELPPNFSFLVSHRLIPPAMEMLLGVEDLQIEGFIAPGHVSAIIGLKPYELFTKVYQMPTVVAGFEPNDVLMAIYMILKQHHTNDARLENEYARVVKPEGNKKALKAIHRAFTVTTGHWRGIGTLDNSALQLRNNLAQYDARKKYHLKLTQSKDAPSDCQCHQIIVGKIKPHQCPLFLKTCTPAKPVGACMVSSEGTCRVWAKNVT